MASYYLGLRSIQKDLKLETLKHNSFISISSFDNKKISQRSISFECLCALYNLAAEYSIKAVKILQSTVLDNETKLKDGAMSFQYSASILETIWERFLFSPIPEISKGAAKAIACLMLAQAQECLLYLAANRKASKSSLSKIAYETSELYKKYLITEGDEEGYKTRFELEVSFQTQKYLVNLMWAQYYKALQHTEEQIGEAIARLHFCVKLINRISPRSDALEKLLHDIQIKISNMERENEILYHCQIPKEEEIVSLPGHRLAKSIPFETILKELIKSPDFSQFTFNGDDDEAESDHISRKDSVDKVRSEVITNIDTLNVLIKDKTRNKTSSSDQIQTAKDAQIAVKSIISNSNNDLKKIQSIDTRVQKIGEDIVESHKRVLELIQDEFKEYDNYRFQYGKNFKQNYPQISLAGSINQRNVFIKSGVEIEKAEKVADRDIPITISIINASFDIDDTIKSYCDLLEYKKDIKADDSAKKTYEEISKTSENIQKLYTELEGICTSITSAESRLISLFDEEYLDVAYEKIKLKKNDITAAIKNCNSLLENYQSMTKPTQKEPLSIKQNSKDPESVIEALKLEGEIIQKNVSLINKSLEEASGIYQKVDAIEKSFRKAIGIRSIERESLLDECKKEAAKKEKEDFLKNLLG
eukprot:GHVP01027568.1.p1 GENE.GHVP01027568.1~~GHVP01027568.1.p1  ORF type:complete len:711 (+),score=139.46 GHVP01027568.1:194-2134(+)